MKKLVQVSDGVWLVTCIGRVNFESDKFGPSTLLPRINFLTEAEHSKKILLEKKSRGKNWTKNYDKLEFFVKKLKKFEKRVNTF